MFNNINSVLTLDDILKKTSVFDIVYKYLGVSELPVCINNPCRKDENPSLGLYYSQKYNTVSYKDFATGETGNIYSLLCELWKCSFNEMLEKINNDINNGDNKSVNLNRCHRQAIHKKSSSELNVKIRDWKDYDLDFWAKYGISLEWLKFGDVFPISYIIITEDNGTTQYIKAEKFAYVYVERKDNRVTLKTYQPYSKTRKWLSKHDASVIDLWTKLPNTGDFLIITSSRKDALCTWANTGIPCISMQGEGYWPKEKIINQLKERFKHIFVLFDNDFSSDVNHGHLFAQKLSSYYNLKMLELPAELGEKDQSDLVKHYGSEMLRKVIFEQIKNSLNN